MGLGSAPRINDAMKYAALHAAPQTTSVTTGETGMLRLATSVTAAASRPAMIIRIKR
jgi:hypothetical protein